MGETFRALRSRNYRLFFGGQTLSLIGSWMQTVAMSWYVYRITGSEVLLGAEAFATQIPMFLVSPFAGVFTDRVDRRKLLVGTQTLAMCQAIALAIIAYLGNKNIWLILPLSAFVGIVSAFDMPGRQSFVVEMVEDRADLPNAIALNSTQFNIARLIGPALAGVTIRLLGEAACFGINAISYCAVVAALLAMRVPARPKTAHKEGPIKQFREGASYAWHLQPIRSLLILMSIVSFASGGYSVLLAVFAKVTYAGDSGTLGWLFSSVGIGALVAAVRMATRRTVIGLGRWIVLSSTVFGVSMALLGLTHNLWTGVPVLVAMGFGGMTHMASTNTLIQTVVEDRMRGRVMAFYAMSFVGTMPIGSFVSGILSAHYGPGLTVAFYAVISLAGTFGFWRSLPKFREALKPIYTEKGILPASS